MLLFEVRNLGLTQQLNQSRQLWELNQKDPNRLTQLQTNLETYQQQKEIIVLTEARRAAKTGNLSEEISYYENALSLKSTQSYWVYRNLSHAYWQKGMKEKALETLNQSIAQEQIPIVGYEIMANWLRDLKREKAYEKTLAEVIQYDEDIAIVQKALGKLMLQHNQLQLAEKYLHRVVFLAPDDLEANFLLSKFLKQQGEYAPALTITRQLMNHQPNNVSIWFQYLQLLVLTQESNIEQVLNQWLKMTPDNLKAHLNCAKFLAKQEYTVTSSQLLDKIIQQLPTHSDGLSILQEFLRFRQLPKPLSKFLSRPKIAKIILHFFKFVSSHDYVRSKMLKS